MGAVRAALTCGFPLGRGVKRTTEPTFGSQECPFLASRVALSDRERDLDSES
jgi:hypothetical protein